MRPRGHRVAAEWSTEDRFVATDGGRRWDHGRSRWPHVIAGGNLASGRRVQRRRCPNAHRGREGHGSGAWCAGGVALLLLGLWCLLAKSLLRLSHNKERRQNRLPSTHTVGQPPAGTPVVTTVQKLSAI